MKEKRLNQNKQNTSEELSNYIEKFNELRTIFDNLPEGIVTIIDSGGKIVAANKTWARLMNLDPDFIINKKINEILGPGYSVLSDIIKETISTKKPVRNFSFDCIEKPGVTRTFLISTALLQANSSDKPGLVLVFHDISEVTRLRKQIHYLHGYDEIVANSKEMDLIFEAIDSVKDFDTSVLITGETGTGKELVARAIHNSSPRKHKPFIPVHAAALSESILESELFGHVKGAFTGAVTDRIGRLQMADEGTLFLDEVGTFPDYIQVKLLRFLQDKVIEPVGSTDRIKLNVRIISATNRDLSELVANEKFREDLYYRLNVMNITVPPLRERKSDVLLLIDHFIKKLNAYYNRNIIGVGPSTAKKLKNYYWPGNVRELENAIEHAYVLSHGPVLDIRFFPADIRLAGTPHKHKIAVNAYSPKEEELDIKKAIFATAGNIQKAAKLLDMHRSTLWRKMREFNIQNSDIKKMVN